MTRDAELIQNESIWVQPTAGTSEAYLHFTIRSMNLSNWRGEGERMLQSVKSGLHLSKSWLETPKQPEFETFWHQLAGKGFPVYLENVIFTSVVSNQSRTRSKLYQSSFQSLLHLSTDYRKKKWEAALAGNSFLQGMGYLSAVLACCHRWFLDWQVLRSGMLERYCQGSFGSQVHNLCWSPAWARTRGPLDWLKRC